MAQLAGFADDRGLRVRVAPIGGDQWPPSRGRADPESGIAPQFSSAPPPQKMVMLKQGSNEGFGRREYDLHDLWDFPRDSAENPTRSWWTISPHSPASSPLVGS